MIIGRLLMRLLLVPLGGCVAVCVAMLFVMVAHWNRIAALTGRRRAAALMAFVRRRPGDGGRAMVFMLLPGLARRADRRGIRDPLVDLSTRQRRTLGLGRAW